MGAVASRAAAIRLAVLTLLTVVSLAGCKVHGECSLASDCSSDQICHATYGLCVRDLPPRIRVTAPAVTEVFTARQVTVEGLIEDESLSASAELRILPSNSWQPLPIDATGRFALTTELPERDLGLIQIEIRASDPSGKQAARIHPFFADNVPPRAWLEPSSSERPRVPTFVGIQFSEPIASPAPDAITIAPAPLGARWNPTGDQYLLGLQPNTAYTVSANLAGLRDSAGNLAQSLPSKLITEPVVPASGPLALKDVNGDVISDIAGFAAASDADGVISLAFRHGTASPRLQWGQFSPVTGLFDVLSDTPADQLSSFRVDAMLPGRDRIDLRTSSLTTANTDPVPFHTSTAWIDAYGALVGSGNNSNALLPGTPCDPNAAPAFGFIRDNSLGEKVFSFPGAVDRLLGLKAPARLAFASPENWDLAEVDGGQLVRQAFRCACGSPISCTVGPRSVATGSVAGSDGNLSVAATEDGAVKLLLIDLASPPERAEFCFDCVAGDCAPIRQSRSIQSARRVAVGSGGRRLIAAHKNETLGIELLERDVTACAPSGTAPDWTGGIFAPGTSGVSIGDFQPVLVGSKPGVIYRLAGRLHLYVAP